MKKISVILLFAVACVFTSCSEDDEIRDNPNDFVTYTGTVKAIMDANCLNCHGDPLLNGAPMPLLSYNSVREAVENRDLVGRIEDGSMPPGNAPDLTAAEIQAVKDWRIGNYKE